MDQCPRDQSPRDQNRRDPCRGEPGDRLRQEGGWLWRDRRHAGALLAEQLAPEVHHHQDTTVVGIPPGGLEVAAALASVLQLPLTCWSVQRVRLPGRPGPMLGAIAPGHVHNLDEELLQRLGFDAEARHRLLHDHEHRMRLDQDRFGDPDPRELSHRRLILVDEGVRTGRVMEAALQSLRSLYPTTITVAVPVGTRSALAQLEAQADRLLVLHPVEHLAQIADWFADLPSLQEGDVIALLRAA